MKGPRVASHAASTYVPGARYRGLQGKVVDWVEHQFEEGVLYIQVRFRDKTELSWRESVAFCSNTVDEIFSFTGTLSQDGKSFTGTYTTTFTPPDMAPGDSGTLQASVSGTATGTYSAQVAPQLGGTSYPITFSLTQNSDGSVTGSGMVSNMSCVGTFTLTNSSTNPSFAVGGAFHVGAVVGSNTMYLDGVPNGDGTYAIDFYAPAPCAVILDGTATKK